ncbi:HEPN domain-containing protein [Synechocystis salina LEGE 06099]|nr:HEPN domain-containing protein [Synechocystis salina LEGE 06099]
MAEAFLAGEELAFSKHSAVIAAFGRLFAKTHRVPPEFHRFLIEAQELRATGDYGQFNAVTLDQAKEQIHYAEAFLSLATQGDSYSMSKPIAIPAVSVTYAHNRRIKLCLQFRINPLN